jgi:competence protein ComEC
MGTLSVTLIDVGWGDSIFIEHIDKNNKPHRALIDSNDTMNERSAEIFLKKYLRRNGIKYKENKPNFEFVMISHWHGDHISGLTRIIKEFGTTKLYYPKTTYDEAMATMLEFIETEAESHESLDSSLGMEDFGDVKMEVLWPPEDTISSNENKNSIVLKMTLDNVKFFLTGDAEGTLWNKIIGSVPSDTKFFKVPHHGSKNGTLTHDLPNETVITVLENSGRDFYRTDHEYHLTFTTDGNNMKKTRVKYSRV